MVPNIFLDLVIHLDRYLTYIVRKGLHHSYYSVERRVFKTVDMSQEKGEGVSVKSNSDKHSCVVSVNNAYDNNDKKW